ncbi:MAG: GNAT family N-acetyltransferase [Nitrospirota bacterium]|nr:GNAT family N-acetyltransferase [Nitrospirota bacterium]
MPHMIRHAETDSAIARCFSVLYQLRPHLEAGTFVSRVRRQMERGYRMTFVEAGGEVVSVAGYRIAENLAWGRFLYVDDLVTDAAYRSRGFGGHLLERLIDIARKAGCDQLHLDSGVQRMDAHRFYEAHHMEFTSHHFRLNLTGP